jgi:AcrR family transcriptional regulator
LIKNNYFRRRSDFSTPRQKRRKEILLAAVYLFRKKGFLATTIDDIAFRVKINKATIYYYFRDKDQILFEIVSNSIDQLIEGAQHIVSSSASPLEKMKEILMLHLRSGTDPGNLGGVAQFERKNLPPKLLKIYDAQRDEYERIYRGLISQGIAMGQIKEGDPCMLGRFILGLKHSIVTWFKESGPLSIEQVGEEAWNFISQSIQKNPPVEFQKQFQNESDLNFLGKRSEEKG